MGIINESEFRKCELNIRLRLTYDGSGFKGWQRQTDDRTVQGELEKQLSLLYSYEKNPVLTIGAGRTDAGAHALNYPLNFTVKNNKVPLDKMSGILNRMLPEDIRVLSAEEVTDDYHARFSTKAREYIYRILISEDEIPFYRNYMYLLKESPDLSRIRKVCRIFEGKHSFKNFCVKSSEISHFERTVYYFRVARCSNQLIFFIKGEGFLRGMIRSLISVCLNAGWGKISREEIFEALSLHSQLKSCQRIQVPASGLYFKRAFE